MADDATDIAIVGAGAAGLATAVFAAETGARVQLLDGAKIIGAKILVSGGGRCNVTHDRVSADDYNGPSNVVRNVLREFDERRTVAWFDSMGVSLKREDTGKLFPTTDDARTVLDALLDRCRSLRVHVRTQHRVKDVRRDDHGFTVAHADGEVRARRVVLATGGRSLPKTGSDGGAYAIARRLGHTVTPTYPALVPLVLAEGFIHAALSGIAHDVELSTFADGKRIDQRTGSMLWTHFGVSGPVAMDASRHWVIAHAEGRSPKLAANLLPGESFESVERRLVGASPQKSAGRIVAELLPSRVVEALCRHVGVPPETRLAQLKRDDRRRLVHALVGLELPVERDRGWNFAEVTAGGVPMAEVDHRTMSSRIVEGLHLVGEILDVDGRIGGFNFQWAWSTGHLCGKAMGGA